MSKVPHIKIAATAVLPVLLCGCPSPDPQAKFDSFLKDTKEERDEALGQKLDVSGALADISGTHLFALAASIAPTSPLQFIATVTLTTTPTGGTLHIEFQPLALEVGSTTEPRTFAGEVLVLPEAEVDMGGGFALDLGEVAVTGDANPITGSDIVATLMMEGAIQNTDLWCGTIGGAVSVPADIDLTGSKFAAVRIEATDPASLPTDVQAMCPTDGGGGGESGGMGDTDTDTATGG
jgi:hypothetical protein